MSGKNRDQGIDYPVGVLLRLMAFVIDLFICFIIMVLLFIGGNIIFSIFISRMEYVLSDLFAGYFSELFIRYFSNILVDSEEIHDISEYYYLLSSLFSISGIFYFGFLDSFSCGTIGKKIFKIRVVKNSGGYISFFRAAGRFVINIVTLFLGAIPIVFGK